MTYEDFTPEILRLYRGFNAEGDLTPEKLTALYDGMAQFAIGHVRDAVSAALREPRMPAFNRLAEFAAAAEDADRQADRQRFDADAKRFLSESWQPTEPAAAPSPTWAADHKRAVLALLDGRKQEATEILRAIGSPASLDTAVPIDKGAWLRSHGLDANLWPPSFCDRECLQHMGWPWPEWPKTIGEFRDIVASKRDPKERHLARLQPANEDWFQRA